MTDSLYSNRKHKVESLEVIHFAISTLPSQGQKNLSALGQFVRDLIENLIGHTGVCPPQCEGFPYGEGMTFTTG